MSEEVYKKLAKPSSLGMGYPEKEELFEILRENFTPPEAEVALAIPTRVIPLNLFRCELPHLKSQERNWRRFYQIWPNGAFSF